MARTNWTGAKGFHGSFPHTFNAMQHLIMSMNSAERSRGKSGFFGRDKGLSAYKKFEDKFKDTLMAMVLDGIIERNADPATIRLVLIGIISMWSELFPNWIYAYAFADKFLVGSEAVAEDRIASAMR